MISIISPIIAYHLNKLSLFFSLIDLGLEYSVHIPLKINAKIAPIAKTIHTKLKNIFTRLI